MSLLAIVETFYGNFGLTGERALISLWRGNTTNLINDVKPSQCRPLIFTNTVIIAERSKCTFKAIFSAAFCNYF